LTALLGQESLRQKMGRNAAEYALNYDWGKIALKIVEVYSELIGISSKDTSPLGKPRRN
jgi:glycosyltransferase involved in cell wall biosynthesis